MPELYDGFISYSHAADDLLAPRLQSGLQRFAKPWWKRRALRVFRDGSSLSANPHLWSSITSALDDSEWFVLLLSEDAASSEWVGREIEYWLANKDPQRILPVVTDGEFGWGDGDISVSSTAAPPALSGVFSEEPRWVDLRWARTDEHLDLSNPLFSDAVADIASALRGIPKDELASEEVRQHRRTIRTAWAAGVVVLLLGVAAAIGAVVAVGQSNEAQDQRDEAQRQTEIAKTERDAAQEERDRADEQARIAEQERQAARDAEAQALENEQDALDAQAATEVQRDRADEQAKVAKSRELAASAVAVVSTDPELAAMLAIESVRATPAGSEPSPEGIRALRQAQLSNLLVGRFNDIGTYAAMSPDGSRVYSADAEAGAVVALERATGATVWTSPELPDGEPGRVAVSPDGSLVAVQVHMPGDHRVVVLNAGDGSVVASLSPGTGCESTDREGLSRGGGFSAGGQWFSVFTGTAQCGQVAGEGWVAVYDTSTWQETYRVNTADGRAVDAEISEGGDRILITSGASTAEVRTFPELDLIHTFEEAGQTAGALSPDGKRVALWIDTRYLLADADTGAVIDYLDRASDIAFIETFVFSPSGRRLLVATRSRGYLYDGASGRYLGALGGSGQTFSSSFSRDDSLLLTTRGGDALVWALLVGTPILSEDFTSSWINPDWATSGPALAVNSIDFVNDDVVVSVIDPDSGQVIAYRPGHGEQLADGRFVVFSTQEGMAGGVEVWDPYEESVRVLNDCVATYEEVDDVATPIECDGGDLFFAGTSSKDFYPAVSPRDGSLFAAASLPVLDLSRDEPWDDRIVRVWDSASLTPVYEFPIPGTDHLIGMTNEWLITHTIPDPTTDKDLNDRVYVYDLESGDRIATLETDNDAADVPIVGRALVVESLLYFRDASGHVYVYDTSAWQPVTDWVAHQGVIRGWELSSDGSLLATAGADGFVHIWDVEDIRNGAPIDPLLSVPAPLPTDVVWLADDRIAVFLTDFAAGGRWFQVFLDPVDLLADARASITRGFTESECVTYQIEECPMTLEEIRSRG